MGKRYCPECKKYVEGTKKKFSWAWFLIGFGVFYLPYHWWLKSRNRCPICGLKTKRKE